MQQFHWRRDENARCNATKSHLSNVWRRNCADCDNTAAVAACRNAEWFGGVAKFGSAIVMINGNKTYIVAIIASLYAIVGFLYGGLDAQQASEILMGAGGLGALRHAISKGK